MHKVFLGLFCVCPFAVTQTFTTYIGDCSDLKSESAKRSWVDAQAYAEKVFAHRVHASIVWGGCADPDFSYDLRVWAIEVVSGWGDLPTNTLITCYKWPKPVDINLAFAEKMAGDAHFTASKILGAAILSAIAQQFTAPITTQWNKYDLQFIENDQPQGYTNAVIKAIRRGMARHTAGSEASSSSK
jgi:hypothetical protein